MKILLLHPSTPKVLVANNPKFVDEARGENPPLGIMYIAGYLKKFSNHTVDIYDGQLHTNLPEVLQKNNYDIVGISIVTFTLIDSLRTIKEIKTYSPKSIIVVGGTHPTIYPKEMLKLGADIVVQGEGEHTFLEVLNNIDKEQKIFTPRKFEEDLDVFPFPYRTEEEKYYSVFSRGNATTIITSRGCSFGCSFCFRAAMGRKTRYRSPINVVEEITECVKKNINAFMFYDDTFTIKKDRVIEICQLIIKNKLNIKFDVRTRVDTIDKEILYWLKKAGIVQIRLGIESGVQRILDRMKKGITLQQTENAFKWCKEAKIETCGYAMFGTPDETREDIFTTMKFIKKIQPDFVHIAVFTPFPATDSYLEWVEKNQRDVWLEFANNPMESFSPPIWGDIPREELEYYVTKFYKEYYFNPKFILKTLWRTKDYEKIKKYFNAGLKLIKERW